MISKCEEENGEESGPCLSMNHKFYLKGMHLLSYASILKHSFSLSTKHLLNSKNIMSKTYSLSEEISLECALYRGNPNCNPKWNEMKNEKENSALLSILPHCLHLEKISQHSHGLSIYLTFWETIICLRLEYPS